MNHTQALVLALALTLAGGLPHAVAQSQSRGSDYRSAPGGSAQPRGTYSPPANRSVLQQGSGTTQRGSGTVQQGSGTTRGGSGAPRGMTHNEFQQAFWHYLTASPSAYRRWQTFPGNDPGVYAGQSPHGAFLRLYANSKARTAAANLPHGSILVKENFGEDGQTLMAVTVMYRAPRYDPQHNDWYWIKYLPDGTVAQTPPDKGSRPIAGRFASCIDCHESADGDDYAFVND